MDTSVQYLVLFNGKLRNGFERSTVMESLAHKLHLNTKQVQQLFDGSRKYVLKRTASQEDAKRYVMQLARLGVVAGIEPATGDKETKAPEKAQQTQPQTRERPLPEYAPLQRRFLFRPLLYLSATLTILFTLVYAVILLGVVALTLTFTFFNPWANGLVEQPLPALLLQTLTILFGALATVVLLKPLLAIPRVRDHGIAIQAAQEPDMHLFVEDLCQQLQLPMPQNIRLSNDIGVRFRHHGLLGFLKGQSTLILGAPLLAAVNTRQLAGLIALAAYRFSPPGAPRAASLVLTFNQWAHQAIHGEDVIDLWLKRRQDAAGLLSGPSSAMRRLFAFSRKVMALCRAVSMRLERPLMHRLIADADSRAVALSGSEDFKQMLGQQQLLHHATNELLPKLRQKWRDSGKLPEDLIQLIVKQARTYPAGIQRQLHQQQEAEKARTADPIPSDAQRIAGLPQQPKETVYDCLAPANTLLRYFAKLAVSMTLAFYHKQLKAPVSQDKLTHVVPKGSTEFQANRAIDGFFDQLWSPAAALKLGPSLQELNNAEDARAQWHQAITMIEQTRSEAAATHRNFIEDEEQLFDDLLKEHMYRAELWRELGEKKLSKEELEAYSQWCRDCENAYGKSLQQLRRQINPYAQRLTAALALLQFSPNNPRAASVFREAAQLTGLYNRIESLYPQVSELKQHTVLLQMLLSFRSKRKRQNLTDLIDEQAEDIRRKLTTMRIALKDLPNPYPAPHGGNKIMEYLLLDSYAEETPRGDFDRGNDVVRRLELLQKRILARLIAIARHTEKNYLQ